MDRELRFQLLRLLDKNSRLQNKELATMLSVSEEEVAKTIKQLEKEQIICGYHTIINWEKELDSFVTAMVELRVTPQGGEGYNQIASFISQYPQVETLYLMSGGYDFLVIMNGSNLKEVSLFISDKLASMEEVQSTTTHFILTKYKEEGIALNALKKDGRMVVSP